MLAKFNPKIAKLNVVEHRNIEKCKHLLENKRIFFRFFMIG